MQVLTENMNDPRANTFGKKGHIVQTNTTRQTEEATDRRQERPVSTDRKETVCEVTASQYKMQFKYHLG